MESSVLPSTKLRPLLVLPGLVAGFIVATSLSDAYSAVFGDNAPGQLAVPFVIVGTVAAISAGLGQWGRWAGGGAIGGAAVAVAFLGVLGSLFPSAASVTDKAGSRMADAHLAELERKAEFRAAPEGYRLRKAVRGRGCSDWFDRREPATLRQYDPGDGTPEEAVAYFRQVWEAAGYQQVNTGGGSPDYRYLRMQADQGGWTVTLSVFADGKIVEVAGRDADSHACKRTAKNEGVRFPTMSTPPG